MSSKIPTKSYKGDAGFDLYIDENRAVGNVPVLVSTNVSMEIPDGFFGMIVPRSSTIIKKKVMVYTGIVDSGYRGVINVMVSSIGNSVSYLNKGDRIAQLLILPVIEAKFYLIKEHLSTDRGERGFGSSGN